jgi:hypothetical protein
MPTALRPRRHWQGAGWRAVEAQHRNATISLVKGDVEKQAVLEDIIDSAKPALPVDAQGLHFLLATPFRYRPRPPTGTRFRGRFDPAVFYGAEEVATACAEAGYWRLRFWLDSEALSTRATSMQMTLFQFHGATGALIDLTLAPFKARRRTWTRPDDYSGTQKLARQAREEGIEMIRSESVRNEPRGRCLTLLTPRVFKAVRHPFRGQQQTWNLFLQPPGLVLWQRDFDDEQHRFEFS